MVVSSAAQLPVKGASESWLATKLPKMDAASELSFTFGVEQFQSPASTLANLCLPTPNGAGRHRR